MRLVIIGGGGQGRIVAEAALLSGVTDIFVVDPQMVSIWPLQIGKCVRTEEEAGLFDLDAEFVVAIGDNRVRQALHEKYMEKSLRPKTVIHPAATISQSAEIGQGAMIMAGSIVGSLARIGCGTIVNHGAIAEHDSVLGEFSHLGPGSVLCGGARIGRRSFLGANSCVRHNVTIGNDITIGHGAVVSRSVFDAGTYVGIPARPVKKDSLDMG